MKVHEGEQDSTAQGTRTLRARVQPRSGTADRRRYTDSLQRTVTAQRAISRTRSCSHHGSNPLLIPLPRA